MAEASASTIPQQLRENDPVVVLPVASGVEDRDRPFPCDPAEILDPLTVLAQLVAIAGAKCGEAGRDVVERPPELVAWSQLTRPLVEGRALARDTARPDVVDQHAIAVGCVNRVVDAF